MTRGLLLAALLVASATACATWSLVEGDRVAMGDLYTVDPIISWNSHADGDRVVWTLDGPSLQRLIFLNAVEGDDPLFGASWFLSSSARKKLHRFRRGMDAFEIEELISEVWSQSGWSEVRTQNLAPAPFGPFDGFRFDLSCLSDAGLEYRGLVQAAVVQDRLYVILFLAVRVHSYEKLAPIIERILRSIQAA